MTRHLGELRIAREISRGTEELPLWGSPSIVVQSLGRVRLFETPRTAAL